jgi:hypothetical protein
MHLTAILGRLTDNELSALLTGLRAMRSARLAFHLEKQESGLVAVRTGPATSEDEP